MEWSMTRSTGTRGLMSSGSLPMASTAFLMDARSVTAAPPVRSWRRTLAGIQGMSRSVFSMGFQDAAVRTSSSVMVLPSLCLSMDSTMTLME